MDRTQRSDVLERHLGRAVLADRHTCVRARQPQIDATDRGHADEVVRAREERGKGGGEGIPAARVQADCSGDELLLGDVHLEEAVGVRLLEDLGERRVADLAVERDHVSAGGPERGERLAVRLPRRHLLPELVARQLERPVRELVWFAGLRLGDIQRAVHRQGGQRLHTDCDRHHRQHHTGSRRQQRVQHHPGSTSLSSRSATCSGSPEIVTR